MHFIAQRTSLARLVHELLRPADRRISVPVPQTACQIEGVNGERWSPGNSHSISLPVCEYIDILGLARVCVSFPARTSTRKSGFLFRAT
jgi:hypothetical protein